MRSPGVNVHIFSQYGRHAVNRDWFAEFHPLRFRFWLQTTVRKVIEAPEVQKALQQAQAAVVKSTR